jgi:hypothetical protein
MGRRPATLVFGLAAAALALGGCGVSVAAGGRDAATHPASGIWVSPTVGGGNVSGGAPPAAPFRPPPSTPPASRPSGLASTLEDVQRTVTGGCWENAHYGSVYGAYDQFFWWQGDCGDTVGQVTVEVYPSAVAAKDEAHHPATSALLARYLDGAVIVDVYTSAPLSVLSQLGTVKGLAAVTSYSG